MIGMLLYKIDLLVGGSVMLYFAVMLTCAVVLALSSKEEHKHNTLVCI